MSSDALARRRDAALRLPPLRDGRHDPVLQVTGQPWRRPAEPGTPLPRPRPISLAEITRLRLKAAGIGTDDPALAFLRSWNQAAADRQLIRVETRRGQFGATRLVRLDEVDQQ